ncbi:MAG TPA: MerR family transcriptional regulator [Opitutaceae bacterium]
MTTIRQLAAEFGLTRSTLLYYDRIGLLRPDYRTSAGYRLYNDADRARLAAICRYRTAGLTLERIAPLLDEAARPRSAVQTALHERLTALNREIAALRRQQQVVVKLLGPTRHARRTRIMTKERWVALLRAAGMDDAEMQRWHEAFEAQSPEAHRDFLESLGLSAAEIRRIRRASRRR